MNKKGITGVILVGVLILLTGCKGKESSISKDVYPPLVKTSDIKDDFSKTKEETEGLSDNHSRNDQQNDKVDETITQAEESQEVNSKKNDDNLQNADTNLVDKTMDEQDKTKTEVTGDIESIDENVVDDEEKLDNQDKLVEDESENADQEEPHESKIATTYHNTYLYQISSDNNSIEFQVKDYDTTIHLDENTYYSSNAHRLINVQANNKVLEEIGFEQDYWYDYNDKFIAYVDDSGQLIYYNRYTKKKKDLQVHNIAYLRVIDNCIYYYSTDEKALYCYKNGQHRKIVEDNIRQYEVVGNKVYFYDNNLYRANLDGTNKERVTDIPITALISINDEVFYIEDADVNALYRITNNDTKGQLIGIIPVVQIEDYFTENEKLYIHYKNNAKNVVTEIDILGLSLGEWLLKDSPLEYITDNNYLAICEKTGQDPQGTELNIYAISPYEFIKSLNDCKKVGFIRDGSIYYIVATGNEIKKYDIQADSIETFIIEDYPIEELYLENDILYYGANKENMKEILLLDDFNSDDVKVETEAKPVDEE